MANYCVFCPHNGGVILTTYPPKIRCDITGNLHFATDSCDDESKLSKHGRWVKVGNGDCCYKCSECGFLRDAYILDVGNYCPQCGAQMDKEENDFYLWGERE